MKQFMWGYASWLLFRVTSVTALVVIAFKLLG